MVFNKDPQSTLDYSSDWAAWLAVDGDTISSHTVTADTGISVNSSTNTTTDVTVWLSGGTAGVKYRVTVQITTAAGRVDQRSMDILVLDR